MHPGKRGWKHLCFLLTRESQRRSAWQKLWAENCKVHSDKSDPEPIVTANVIKPP